jgi:16S rRNA (uracil1498-N3)-methyltransferase
MSRFYVDLPITLGANLELPDNVVRHMNVLRLHIGDSVALFNGDGCDYTANISELSKRHAKVNIEKSEKLDNESHLKITLMPSLIASDKFDLIVQKAVELGVNEIVPVISQYTQRLSNDKISSRMEHWRKVIIAACEQSARATIPNLSEPTLFSDALLMVSAERKYVLSPHHERQQTLVGSAISSVAVLIGPEGGFSLKEVEEAQDNGFLTLQLSTRILRAETAAICAVSLLQSYFGDFGLIKNNFNLLET